ncbi:MAG: polysaccharide deacetylase family protein, partial [Verrucomicrobiales bacterium]|nr:polysaccharide deacetylase family protein [Verrucomicrobiales bacterium]
MKTPSSAFGTVRSSGFLGRIASVPGSIGLLAGCLAGAWAGNYGSDRPASGSRADSRVPFEFPFETYRQELVVTFDSEEAAAAATLAPTPLWDDRAWAVSSRWDDLHPNNPRMADVLRRRGHSGTFYLGGWFSDWDAMPTSPDSEYGRGLVAAGHSIGGHSLSHPWLSYCHRNRMFEEMAGVRMLWEAATDTPVVSYAFSYSNSRNEDEGDAVQADLMRSLERAGLYHVANEREFERVVGDLILSPILPADGMPIVAAAEAALADDAYRREHPILTYAMHALYDTPEAWSRFEADLDRYGGRTNWWYCPQNAYAAYRYQVLHARLSEPERVLPTEPRIGRTHGVGNAGHGMERAARRWIVERPKLVDLNDAVPLTFRVAGIAAASVVDVRCATARVSTPGRDERGVRFDVPHDDDQRLPIRIGFVRPNLTRRSEPTESDTDTDIAGVRALLGIEGERVRLRLDNRSGRELRGLRVTYRLPLAWADGVVRRAVPDMAPGDRLEDSWTPWSGAVEPKWRAGEVFVAAQVDFRYGDEPVRLHVACRTAMDGDDPSYPQGGFARLGPLPLDQVDLPRLLADLRSGAAATVPWRIDDGSVLEWATMDEPTQPPYFDPERIRLDGRWTGWDQQGWYVVVSELRND